MHHKEAITLTGAAIVAGLALSACSGSAAGPPDPWADAAASAHASARMAATVKDVALGQRMAAAYGWGSGEQWSCLDALWTRASRWDPDHSGPDGELGIAAAVPGASWSAIYPRGNAPKQVASGLAYISRAYFWPCSAWIHETWQGWY